MKTERCIVLSIILTLFRDKSGDTKTYEICSEVSTTQRMPHLNQNARLLTRYAKTFHLVNLH